MNVNDYDFVVRQQMEKSLQTLMDKAREYGTTDLLHAFKQAAALQGITTRAALAGMMAKHTVSVYDMCHNVPQYYDMAVWEEKLGDHINYLLILKAVVVEELMERNQQDEALQTVIDFPSENVE